MTDTEYMIYFIVKGTKQTTLPYYSWTLRQAHKHFWSICPVFQQRLKAERDKVSKLPH